MPVVLSGVGECPPGGSIELTQPDGVGYYNGGNRSLFASRNAVFFFLTGSSGVTFSCVNSPTVL